MASDPRDYKLDLTSLPEDQPAQAQGKNRPYLSVHFRCCNVHQRIYRSPEGDCYNGRCPRCGRPIRFEIGQGGTDQRSFIVE